MTKDSFFTIRWNNIITVTFGLPIIGFAYIGLSTDVLSDFAGFVWMLVLGAFY